MAWQCFSVEKRDKIDLLKPKYVNPENNYRYYTYILQFRKLEIHTVFRRFLHLSTRKISRYSLVASV